MNLEEYLFSAEGRINRKQFWGRHLIIPIEALILFYSYNTKLPFPLFVTACLTIIGSYLSAVVKRLHDTNRSGLNAFWAIAPFSLLVTISFWHRLQTTIFGSNAIWTFIFSFLVIGLGAFFLSASIYLFIIIGFFKGSPEANKHGELPHELVLP